MKLWVKILVAMGLGILFGAIFGKSAQLLAPIGDIFLRLINMIIVPLVLSSMAVGITSIHDPQKLGRVGLKTLFLYIATTAIAIGIGLVFAKLIRPGAGLHLEATLQMAATETPSISELLIGIIPKNPFEALAKAHILQVIVFAIFLGISINFAGDRGRPLLELLESLADVMYRLTSIIMEFSPYGVFAIIAATTGQHGLKALSELAIFLFAYLAACAVHVVVVDFGLLYFFARLNPLPFLRGMSDALMVAFSTASSSAALPVSMHCVQENLGVSKNMSSFVLPLGSTVNMNGAAIFQGMAALFVAQVYGVQLDFQQLMTIVVTAVLSAVGAAGVPGSGFIMLSAVFTSVGLPVEGLALLWGIDRVREMFSTVLNVMGDSIVAIYVAKQEGELDERQYYHAELIELEGSDI